MPVNTATPLLVFATLFEAEPFLQRLGAERMCDNPFTVFRSTCSSLPAEFLILITGMGLQSAKQAMHFVVNQYNPNHIINCGIAGTLHDNINIGDIYQVGVTGSVNDEQPNQIKINWTVAKPDELTELPAVRLLSVQKPLFNGEQKHKLSPYAQLVDMEGAAIAQTCRQYDLPYQIFKIVSDDAEDRQLLLDNLHRLSDQLANYIYLRINQLLPQRYPVNSHSDSLHRPLAKEKRLGFDAAVQLFSEITPDRLSLIGEAADHIRQSRFGLRATYVHNLQINPTNICVRGCDFCGFAVLPGKEGGYSIPEEDILKTVAKANPSEVHIVGGLSHDWKFKRSLNLVKKLRQHFPALYIKSFTAVEMDWFAKTEKRPIEEILSAFIEAGMNGMPGGGAEMFSERIRKQHFRQKLGADDWLAVHEAAHKLGIPTNATMLYGMGESLEERIVHLFRLRDLQDKTDGFVSFIPLAMQFGINDSREMSPLENLQVIAMSRLVLDNVPHIKAYWPMIGIETAAAALSFGADDLDGTIGLEKIAHASGAKTPKQMAAEEMIRAISLAGFEAVERDGAYLPITTAKCA
jgi:aminodeoxyfutalosine synthase